MSHTGACSESETEEAEADEATMEKSAQASSALVAAVMSSSSERSIATGDTMNRAQHRSSAQ